MHRRAIYLALLLSIALGGASGCALTTPRCDTTISCLRESKSPLQWRVGHRGGGRRDTAYPENTLPAFRRSALLNVRLLETDVRLSPDGTPFLFHDAKLSSRNFVGPSELLGQPVSSIRRELLSRICMPEDPSICVPTLREALNELRSTQSVLLLDIKGADPIHVIKTVMSTLTDIEIREQVIVQCDGLPVLQFVRSHYPAAAVLARAHHQDELTEIIPLHPDIVQIDEEWMTPEILASLHRAGAKVLIKTLDQKGDEPSHRDALFASSVDLVLTDYPE